MTKKYIVNNLVENRKNAPINRLERPIISWRTVLIKAAQHLVFILLGGYFLSPITGTSIYKILLLLTTLTIIMKLDRISIFLIRCYQRYAHAELRLRCCFTPSCSEYAILSIKKYGWIISIPNVANRLYRCGREKGIDYP